MTHSYVYQHPELTRPWSALALSKAEATQRFEDCWALRVAAGLLETVDGNFYDGIVSAAAMPLEEDLCPNDLAGHFWSEDERAERVEMAATRAKLTTHLPIACILCKATSWRRRSA